MCASIHSLIEQALPLAQKGRRTAMMAILSSIDPPRRTSIAGVLAAHRILSNTYACTLTVDDKQQVDDCPKMRTCLE